MTRPQAPAALRLGQGRGCPRESGHTIPCWAQHDTPSLPVPLSLCLPRALGGVRRAGFGGQGQPPQCNQGQGCRSAATVSLPPCQGQEMVAQMVKNPPANAGDAGLVPGSGRSPGEGNGNPLQYSCLENPMGRGAWWATAHGVAESDTAERLNHHHVDDSQGYVSFRCTTYDSGFL